MVSVSVVIPLYNKAPHIAKTLESVLAQSSKPDEIIVVDDGSTDDGPDCVVPYVERYGVRLIRQSNCGDSVARNRGIAESKSEYIAFLDADDYWLSNHIEVLRELIEKYPQAALYSTAHLIERGGARYRPRHSLGDGWMGMVDEFFLCYARNLGLVNSTTACARKAELVQVGAFPVGVRRGPDIICWIKMARKYPVAHAEVVTAVYYQDAVNRTNRLKETDAPGSLKYIAELLNNGQISEQERRSLSLLYDRIAFFTSAGLKLEDDGAGLDAIYRLSRQAGRYSVSAQILLLKLVPRLLLALAKNLDILG